MYTYIKRSDFKRRHIKKQNHIFNSFSNTFFIGLYSLIAVFRRIETDTQKYVAGSNTSHSN